MQTQSDGRGAGHRGHHRYSAALLAAVVLTLTACTTSSAPTISAPPSSDSYVAIPDRPLGPAPQQLSLTDGQPWRFDQTPTGRLTLLFFGFTNCPDVCPSTLADLRMALTKLPAVSREKVDVVVVSTDPERDTPEQLETYLHQFDPTFRGARGEIGDVVAAATAYGISVIPPAPHEQHGNYEVAHGGQLVVLAPGGRAVGYFRAMTDWRDYSATLPSLVETHADR